MSTITTDASLRVNDVVKAFRTPEGGEVRAIDGVSLEINPGEFFVMLGPSGCGKTTLLRTIAGLENADSGSIWLGDQQLDPLPPYRRQVNTVFQSYALFPHLTVAQNIAFGLQMEGLGKSTIRQRMQEMLQLVRLDEHGSRKPSQLSGGQQQRVALARALAKRPAILLLDEPLAALDLKLRRGMQVELKRIQRETGLTFIFVTHDQEEAMSMGDRIAVFDEGRVAQMGSPEEIYQRPSNRFVADFIGETNFFTARVDGPQFRLDSGDAIPRHLVDTSALNGGSSAILAVRPEHLRFAEAGAVLQAVVRQRTFAGADVRVTAELRGGQEVVVRVPAHGARIPNPGETLGLVPLEGTTRVVTA